jgi:hypothetical protein
VLSIFQLGLHFELVLLLGGGEGMAGVGGNCLRGNYLGSNCFRGNYLGSNCVGSRVLDVGGVERCGDSRVDDLLEIQGLMNSL